jgi:hypothetical protein
MSKSRMVKENDGLLILKGLASQSTPSYRGKRQSQTPGVSASSLAFISFHLLGTPHPGPHIFCPDSIRYENLFVCFRYSISRVREQRRGVHAVRS